MYYGKATMGGGTQTLRWGSRDHLPKEVTTPRPNEVREADSGSPQNIKVGRILQWVEWWCPPKKKIHPHSNTWNARRELILVRESLQM